MQTPGTFSHKLAEAMAARQMGARTLGRLIDPDNVEQGRRSVRRWLRGTTATPASRALLCEALGLPEKSLDPDEDVDQALMRELRDQLARLLDRSAA
jgi:hypothetical protein